MDAPDFAKYNEAQLRQILTRIDRERFPDRVVLIETRLAELGGGDFSLQRRTRSQVLRDSSGFTVKPYPGAVRNVFGPALPFFVIGGIAIVAAALLEQTLHRSLFGIAIIIGTIAILLVIGISHFRIHALVCPTCRDKCETTTLENQSWGAICNRCETVWETGVASQD